ncbi:hypothetical protein [Streptomyces canus]|uniref:hypothetical protein n=1 Tax=Streptomyces canus TaxID=58343 RepID=UPI003870461D|nr:hypothetical protein OH824_17955 [Streptomyces canus]
MPLQQFTDSELRAKAVQLGVISEGDELPRNQRSRVAAALLEERRTAEQTKAPADPVCVKEIAVRGSEITVDGKPFPWLVARDPMDISLAPDGSGTVRLTLLAESVQVLKPKTDSTESE